MEKHKKQFTGIWTPAKIWTLMEDGILTSSEKDLLSIIDILIDRKNNIGCFASNDYLGKKLNLTPNRISIMISKLKKMGLIEQIAFDGRQRFLTTCYSCINDFLHEKEESDFDSSQRQSLTGNKGRVCVQKEKPFTYNDSKDNILSEQVGESEISSLLDVIKKPKTKQKKDPKNPRSIKLATMLAESISRIRKVNARSNISKWIQSFDLMMSKDEIKYTRIKKVMIWYGNHLDDEFVPIAHSGTTFRQKFLRIEMAMGREVNKPLSAEDTAYPLMTADDARKFYKIGPEYENEDDEDDY